MTYFRRMAIAPKLLSIAGPLIAALLIIGFAVVTVRAEHTVSTLSGDSANAQADAVARQLIGEIGGIDSTVRSMSASIATVHHAGLHDRALAIAVLRPNVDSSPMALGSWFFEEPRAFDGEVSPGAPGSTPAGAFMPYWIKQDGQIRMEPDTEAGLYQADYYRLAHDTGKPALTEPYPYESHGKTLTMTSLAYPVVSGGRLIGVAGIDLALTDISGDVGQVHALLNQMAADNQAQSSALTQISAAIGTMDQATQQNAAMVEETSAAARNLATEVGMLSDQASRFNTGGEPPRAKPAPRPAPAIPAARPATYTSPVKPLPPRAVAALTRPDDDWDAF